MTEQKQTKRGARLRNSKSGEVPVKRELPLIHPNAAGIDVGADSHFVAVPEDRDERPIREFPCFTADLHHMADWLENCGIQTVAMESTGVYWIPVFQVLESRGFDVKLVNARHVKNVPGRKTDVQDARWIQRLHTYGLLAGSFRPDDQICILRGYIRQRDNLVKTSSSHVQRMQKALTQMNVQLHRVISDITGQTGLRIIDAILAGERNPVTLAAMKNFRIKCSTHEIAKALEGDWRDEHLFALRQELELYRLCQDKITECESEVQRCLSTFDNKLDDKTEPPAPEASPEEFPKAPVRSRAAAEKKGSSLRDELQRIAGVDLTRIPGLEALTVQTILSEVGLDPHKWPNEKHFASWLGLCPHNTITGGRVQSTKTRRVVNRAAQAFRLAAQAVGRSKSAIGAYYRRMRARLGAPEAITATAHKLARLFYRMLKHGEAYVEKGVQYYENQYRDRVLCTLEKRASQLGYQLVAKPAPQEEAMRS
jgi:transposase